MSRQKPVEIIVVLDKSGSMAKLKSDVVGGFNSFLEEQQKLKGEANISLILFNERCKVLWDGLKLSKVKSLHPDEYNVSGYTALYDAIGKAISRLEEVNPEKAIVAILTDGLENASESYSKERVATLIAGCEARGWQFVYLAANQDAFAIGKTMNINKSRTENFEANSRGVKQAFASTVSFASSYRSGK